MPVPNSMADLATLASSNYPTGTEAIGNSLDNYIRAGYAITRSTYAMASATIASASTTDLGGADGESVRVTGTTTINSFGTAYAGCKREVSFAGALTLVNSANIILPRGVNLVTVAEDVYTFRCTAPGVWRLVSGWRDSLAVRRDGDTMTGALTVPNLTVTGTANNGQVTSNGNNPNPGIGIDTFAYRSFGAFGGGYGIVDTPYNIGLYSNFGSFNIGFGASGGVLSSKLTLDRTSGDLTVTGNLISNSDERLKSDWEDIPVNLVERLATVKAGEYYRNDIGCRQVGVGANSMLGVIPLAVSQDHNGIKSVAYGNAALVGVVALARKVLEIERRLA